ncbi:flagellar hook-length control protein FliK [Poriferisphaera sp. WC338]|uniref:flagellar hook-length control protein FliK n=1 Tax=Poriferisphaera sp. WC338 TaxID=3425129 RepID=UPI003D81843D
MSSILLQTLSQSLPQVVAVKKDAPEAKVSSDSSSFKQTLDRTQKQSDRGVAVEKDAGQGRQVVREEDVDAGTEVDLNDGGEEQVIADVSQKEETVKQGENGDVEGGDQVAVGGRYEGESRGDAKQAASIETQVQVEGGQAEAVGKPVTIEDLRAIVAEAFEGSGGLQVDIESETGEGEPVGQQGDDVKVDAAAKQVVVTQFEGEVVQQDVVTQDSEDGEQVVVAPEKKVEGKDSKQSKREVKIEKSGEVATKVDAPQRAVASDVVIDRPVEAATQTAQGLDYDSHRSAEARLADATVQQTTSNVSEVQITAQTRGEVKIENTNVDQVGNNFAIQSNDTSKETPVKGLQLPNTGADNEQQNAARITRGIQTVMNQRGGNLTLRLTPPEMGTVKIQLQIEGAKVNVQLHTQQESARSMLQQQVQQLRQSLEQQGLQVERIGIQNMQSSQQSSMNSQSDLSHEDGRSRGEYAGQQRQGQNDNEQKQEASSFEELVQEEVAA